MLGPNFASLLHIVLFYISIIVFDENHLPKTHQEIKELANELYDANGDNDFEYGGDYRCDVLLHKFHRTVEFDGIPHWQGASVSQICKAEVSKRL